MKNNERMSLLCNCVEALCYFVDAEENEDPVTLNSITWMEIKGFVQKQVREFLK